MATAWPTYAMWAADQLSPTFTCRQAPYTVECVRTATGDTFSVRLSLRIQTPRMMLVACSRRARISMAAVACADGSIGGHSAQGRDVRGQNL